MLDFFLYEHDRKRDFLFAKGQIIEKGYTVLGDSSCTYALLLGQTWVACCDKIKYLSRLLVDCSVNSSSTVSRSVLKVRHVRFLLSVLQNLSEFLFNNLLVLTILLHL